MKPGRYDYVPIERVVWGQPAAEAVVKEAERLGAQRVFTVASKTMARKTEVVKGLRAALGSRDAGLFDECREHAPLESVIACAEAARAAEPDLLLTVGGGSPIDTVKIVQLCLTHDVRSVEALKAFAGRATSEPSRLRQIVVPTTLSAGEYSSVAGATDTAKKLKESYHAPDMCARVVVLDPEATLFTPEWLWLSTAIRALDHAIEGYSSPATNALVESTSLRTMALLSESLRRTKKDPSDLDARHRSQMGVWLTAPILGRVPMGASHGIGYLLGTMAGVPHGYTSCVMLPAVLKWNEKVTGERQKDIAAALGAPEKPASDAVAQLIADLGLPRTLGDVGVTAEQIPAIAARAVQHPVVRTNPRPIRSAEDAEEILRLAV